MRKQRALIWCLPLWLMAVSAPTSAADWPRFRGPNGTGVSETSGLPLTFGARRNIEWKTNVPPGLSSPVVSGNRVFLTAVEDEKLLTLCFDRETGEELWRRECPRPRIEKLDNRNHAAAPSAAADGANVYIFFGDFGLISYDFDGNELWRLPLGPFDNSYGMGASPIVVDDLVVLVCDQRKDSFIIAVDKTTGKPRWRRERPEAISGHSTPVVYETGKGRKQILAPGSFRMDAYAAKTGKIKWWTYGLPSEMKSVPAIVSDMIYVSGYNVAENDAGRQVDVPPFAKALKRFDSDAGGSVSQDELPLGRLRKLFGFSDADGDGELDKSEWRIYAAAQASENGLRAIRLGGKGNRTKKGFRWKHGKGVPQLPSPLVYDGILYMVSDGGRLGLFDAATGESIKQIRLRGAVGHYYASPVAADGQVYLVSEMGYVTVLTAGPKPRVMAVNELLEASYATPAIADGRIYIRTVRRLYCFADH